jgi:hypothetical protein
LTGSATKSSGVFKSSQNARKIDQNIRQEPIW